jgi:hypothetical protein
MKIKSKDLTIEVLHNQYIWVGNQDSFIGIVDGLNSLKRLHKSIGRVIKEQEKVRPSKKDKRN